MNMGVSKGLEFPHVLIRPTKPIRQWLTSADAGKLKPVTATKLYVAMTRARHSVGFISDAEAQVPLKDVTPELLSKLEALAPEHLCPPRPLMTLDDG